VLQLACTKGSGMNIMNYYVLVNGSY